MGVPIYLFDSTVRAYQEARPAIGEDPFPSPQTDREQIVHELWQLRVAVAGWWTMETEQLRDMRDKYLVTQVAEAQALEKEAIRKAKAKRDGPRPEQVSERLREVWRYNQAHKEGRKTQYQGSGIQAL